MQPKLDLEIKIICADIKSNVTENIFKNATFWFQKGYLIQTNSAKDSKGGKDGKDNVDAVALDYYLSGVKIDPYHLGCVYNVGCCYYFTQKFTNAEKWFNLAIKVDP